MAQPVLLGFMDAEIREEELGHFSYNKVGGVPDWACDPPSIPTCTLCSQPLLQVAQVYAPLSSSIYHRTLHLLACPQPPCWNQAGSWRCLRSQQKDSSSPTPATPAAPAVVASLGSATDWLGEADDWGDEDDANGNPAPASPCPSTPSPLGASGGHLPPPSTSGGGHLPPPSTNLNISSCQELDISRLSLAGDGNANSPGLGAAAGNTGGKTGSLATAHAEVEMEGGEEDCVSLEEVARPATDIPGLFCLGNRPLVEGRSQLRIRPHYLWVKEEGQGQEAGDSQEQRLLLEYKAKEALEQVEGGRPRATGGGGEVYEEALPSHGDHFFHSLLTVIQKNPGQVLRYGRLSGSPPLLLRPLPENLPPCSFCGSQTTFELQLLPSLVGQLRIDGVEGAPVEFGTVLVYSCEASCWQDGKGARSETVLVQGENM